MVFVTPRIRSIPSLWGVARISCAGRIPLPDFRKAGVGEAVGNRPISAVLGPAEQFDSFVFRTLFGGVPKTGNSWLSAAQLRPLLLPVGICHWGIRCFVRRNPPPSYILLIYNSYLRVVTFHTQDSVHILEQHNNSL